MRILLAGACGFIGKALKEALEQNGYEVLVFPRDATLREDLTRFESLTACINLAGENISSSRWTKQKKEEILNSRLKTTDLLVSICTHVKKPPHIFINASAVGFYGDRGSEILTESSKSGKNFLSDVCVKWEAAAAPLEKLPIRVLFLRFGAVLAPNGGALAKMLLPFKLGLGGKLGSGNQYFSFISLKDLIGVILFALEKDTLSGPVNVTAPYPVTNAEFTKALAHALHRPAFLTVPAFALRLLLGEMADELLLASARVYPNKLVNAGFQFEHPTIQSLLQDIV